MTGGIPTRSRVLVLSLAACAWLAGACGTDGSNSGELDLADAADASGDTVRPFPQDTVEPDTSDPPDATPDVADTAPPPCNDTCAAEGTTCNGDTLEVCARDANDCLALSTVDCASGGGVCDDSVDPPACAALAIEMVCDDGTDDDGDGLTDCNDPDCIELPLCAPPESCVNGRDDNGDGLTDCDDPACILEEVCQPVETCTNGTDDDDDTLADCDDPDCAQDRACLAPESVCNNRVDEDLDGDTDCADPDCAAATGCGIAEVCNDGFDNDGDGAVDCGDVQCATQPLCNGQEDCTNGADDDGDGLVDCTDSNCGTHAACNGGGGNCDPTTEFECGDGTCITASWECDDYVDCADGSDEAPSNASCGGGTAPAGWTCDPSYYGDSECDCGCGVQDVDCASPAVGSCDWCGLTGACDDGASDCAQINPSQNWLCGGEICDNTTDDDADTLADCADPDCATAPVCITGEDCQNGLEDDGDGLIDCGDPECTSDPSCVGLTEACTNSLDDDRDGLTDCADADCTSDPACSSCDPATEFACSDGTCITASWECDGIADCADDSDEAPINTNCGGSAPAGWTCDPDYYGDSDCDCGCGVLDVDCADATVASCEWCGNAGGCDAGTTSCSLIKPSENWSCGPAEICDNGLDDDADGDFDCIDSECTTFPICATGEDCLNGVNDDADGLVDCADAECTSDPSCVGLVEQCTNTLDDDRDGLTDCADADCTSDPACSSCDPVTEFACGDGTCITASWECDGITDCADDSDEPPVNTSCGGSAPAGWTCDPSYYGDSECDCGCGELDVDCADATVTSCQWCGNTGACDAGASDCSFIDPAQNWLCQ